MTVTASTRLGLTRWSAGTDPFTRSQMDGSFASLDNLVAIDAQGTFAARPAAGVRGRYYWATDTSLVYRDDGAAWFTIGPPIVYAAPSGSAVGDVQGAGSATSAARSDHVHAREAFGSPVASAVADTAANGTAVTVARSDHRHAREAFSVTAPPVVATGTATSAVGTAVTPARSDHGHGIVAATAGASAVGDTAAEGAATSVARSDHRHAREAFGTPGALSPAAAVTAASGSATTPARSDHAHGITAPITPSASAVGDTATVGTSAAFAPGDHRHAREAFGGVATTLTPAATTAATGTATTPARSDHVHGSAAPVTPSSSAPGDAAVVGVSASFAPGDHKHAREARPVTRIPHTFAVPGDLLVISGTNNVIPGFFVPVPAGRSVMLAAARYKIGSGTSVVVAIRRNGAVITGANDSTVTPTAATNDYTDTALADGDYLEIVLSAPTGTPKNLSFTLYLDYTV